jgi:glycosyltransferase involved in cell wall biosynthesis
MRIGLDVRYISHGITGGVRTYVYNLAKELPLVSPDQQFIYYADEKAPFELANELPGNVTLKTLPWRSRWSSILNDHQIGRWMDEDRLNVVHSPGNYGPVVRAPLIVTLHDTLNLFPLSEHLRGFGKRPYQVGLMVYLGHQTRASLKRAARLITVSDHARADIAARSDFPIDRIVTIHEAAEDRFQSIADPQLLETERARLQVGSRFVLADGVKNPGALIEAFGLLPECIRNETDVVFFSREATPRPAVAEALARKRFKFIARPPSSDIVSLMNLATAFAFPSFYEGFGIPLVEAMRCGAPIIASRRGSIPEIVGDAGLLFDLEQPADFARHLESVLGSAARAAELKEQSLRRARHFSWKKAARETLSLYEEVAALQASQL